MTGQYSVDDPFEVNDISSKYHGWNGRVIEVLDDGYYAQVEWFGEQGAVIVFDCFLESQMASTVYLED